MKSCICSTILKQKKKYVKFVLLKSVMSQKTITNTQQTYPNKPCLTQNKYLEETSHNNKC